MSFVSYAQNFEDVMLWRALKHVEKGFYIDVGANDPTIDSVTKAFYERGWHGINIEPLPSHHADLLRERPRDINLHCAAGASNGDIEIWECDVRGWATASANVVVQHTEEGHAGVFHKVPVATLTDICIQNVTDEIHFLKIDVEGFEKVVIDGMDFLHFRPWILVIEATKPNSIQEVHDEWEADVLAANYSLAYCDGLNRFYVAKEHSELLNSLRYPPNVFDGFIRFEQRGLELRAQQAEALAQQAEIQTQLAEAQLRQAEAQLRQAEVQLRQAQAQVLRTERIASEWQHQANQWHERVIALHASTSWQITRPLRAIKQLLSGDFAAFQRSTAAAKLKAKQTFRPLVSSSIKRVFNHPVLRDQLNRQLKSFPWLHQRLRRVALNEGLFSPQAFSRQGRISADKGRGNSFAMSNLNGAAATNVEQIRLLLEEPKQLEIQEILQRIRLELERGNG